MSMHRRDDIARRRFLASLMPDLVSAGFAVVHDSSLGDPKIAKPGVSEQLKHLYRLRAMQIEDAREFIRRLERQGILGLFGDADKIDLSAISPEIHFCASQRDHEIFNYARLFQHVPTANRVGRQIRAVIYDVGQRTPTVMGIFGLASSAYTLGCRDNYLGWRGSENKAIKDAGLRQTLDLAVVLAATPYNFLHGGKLMASLALSEPVRHEVTRRYK
jgi:hypothetical protein